MSNIWGPPSGLNSKSYVLAMAQENPTQPLEELPNHTLGGVSPNLIDALFIPKVVIENGRTKTRYIVSRAAEETHREYTLGFPQGMLFSPALDIARNKPECARDYFSVYKCPSDPQYGHFVVYTNGRLSPPQETEDFITIDDTNAIGEQSTLLLEERLLKFAIFGAEAYASAFTGASALFIGRPDCGTCEGSLYDNVFIGGGTGIALEAEMSVDKLSTFSAVTVTGATATYNITDGIWVGDTIVLALSDDPDPAGTPTAGQIAVSLNGGTTWSIISGATNAYFAVEYADNVVYVGGADGELWQSSDFVNFTQITNNVHTTEVITDLAYDADNSVVYIAATDGAAAILDSGVISDISTAVGAGASDLLAVAVLAEGHIMFGGAAGLVKESIDNADTFATVSVAGTASAIAAIKGTAHRVLVAAGSNVYERSPLTGMLFSAVPLRFGATYGGAIVALDMAPTSNGDNFFVAIDATGDVYVYRPRYPGA